jgi:PAS domain S-box-containing protein
MADLLFSSGRKQRRWVGSAIFLLLLLPLLFIGTFSYLQASRELTANAYARRQSLAYLAATTLKQRLDHLKDIGVALATRVRFRQLIGEGKWNEAAEILRHVPKDFPFIERLFLTDPAGTLMVDVPELPGVRGRNFAFRDWYKGVRQNWLPYVSDIYKRAAAPEYNVIAISIPVKAEDQTIIAVLVLQLRLNALLQWAQDLDVGRSGFVYVVDRQGHGVAPLGSAAENEMVDLSGVPAVQKALNGERGIETAWNPVEKEHRLAAYEPVPGYGWGVIIQQPVTTAFAARNKTLRQILLAYGLICLFAAALAFLFVRTLAERKQHEEALKGNEERFRGMAEAAEDAIISADQEGRITFFNHGAERVFGHASGMMIGKPLTAIMPERFRDAHRAGLKRFLATGEARVIGKTVELVGMKSDGSEFPLELSLSSWKADKGIFFTGILRDITERKQAEEEVRKLNEHLNLRAIELETANKELEAFSYSVSHDLRAPLRAVDGFSRILLQKHGAALPPDAKRYQHLICENAQQMGRLIDDLLSFSRLSRQPLKRQPVDPRHIVDEALQHLSRESDNGQAQISVGKLPACQADPALLKQVYVNLISNAIKYSRKRAGARIEIGCKDDNGPPTYFVRDNGVGFEMKYADKLFGVFQRLHRAEEYEGTGVGLAIVQRIVNRHGGRVWADAAIDKGATFYFTLGGEVQSRDRENRRDTAGRG